MKPMTTANNEPSPVRVKVLRAKFCMKGRLVHVGETLILPHHDAQRLAAAGHVELIA